MLVVLIFIILFVKHFCTLLVVAPTPALLLTYSSELLYRQLSFLLIYGGRISFIISYSFCSSWHNHVFIFSVTNFLMLTRNFLWYMLTRLVPLMSRLSWMLESKLSVKWSGLRYVKKKQRQKHFQKKALGNNLKR